MNRSLLMANVDNLDALVDTAVVERHDMAVGEGEDYLDAGLLESLSCELAAVQGHMGTPFYRDCGFVSSDRSSIRRSAVSLH